jgi:hypothetical protein
MKRMTFELPDGAIAMAFTIVITEGAHSITTFTECHSVHDGSVFTISKIKNDEARYECKRSDAE